MKATIKDVAKLAGVSISTVSRVMNNSKPVSSEVKKKVNKAIEELQYKPNEIARTLVTKKSRLVGVIITDIGDSYVAEMVRGIEEIGKMYGYDILLCSTYEDNEAEINYLNLLNRKQVEGIILISRKLNESVKKQASEYDIPFIYLSRYTYQDEFQTVSINNFEASYEMTNYLIKANHEKIAFVSNITYNNSVDLQKIEGFKKAINESDLGSLKIYYSNGSEIDDGYDIAKEVMSDSFNATALFCANDELAIGMMNYFYDNNVNVPKDKSIVGFGDIKMASYLRPTLTTVVEPFYDIGAVSIRKIIKQLNNEITEEDNISLPFKIQMRDSCIKMD